MAKEEKRQETQTPEQGPMTIAAQSVSSATPNVVPPPSSPDTDYYRLLKWYGLLTLVGLGIAALSWALFPVVGIMSAMIVLTLLTAATTYAFYHFNSNWFRDIKKHYPRTAPFAIAVGVPLVAFVVFMSSSMGLLIPALFLAPFLLRSIIAGSTYFARLADLYKDKNRLKQEEAGDAKKIEQAKTTQRDFWMMVGGTALGIFVMGLSVISDNIAHVSTMDFLAHGFALIAGVGSFGGVFHRPVGNGRMPVEAWTMRIMFGVALIAAVLICSLGLIPAIAATGLMTAGLAGIPFYLFFVPSFVSACVSFSDYVLKTGIYALKLAGNSTCEKYIKESNKEHEYRGAAVGMLIGLALGATLIALMITQPHLFGALLIAKSLGGKIILGFLMGGAISATGSRIGKSLEPVPVAPKENVVAQKVEVTPGKEDLGAEKSLLQAPLATQKVEKLDADKPDAIAQNDLIGGGSHAQMLQGMSAQATDSNNDPATPASFTPTPPPDGLPLAKKAAPSSPEKTSVNPKETDSGCWEAFCRWSSIFARSEAPKTLSPAATPVVALEA